MWSKTTNSLAISYILMNKNIKFHAEVNNSCSLIIIIKTIVIILALKIILEEINSIFH